jgi:hypothetical protein
MYQTTYRAMIMMALIDDDNNEDDGGDHNDRDGATISRTKRPSVSGSDVARHLDLDISSLDDSDLAPDNSTGEPNNAGDNGDVGSCQGQSSLYAKLLQQDADYAIVDDVSGFGSVDYDDEEDEQVDNIDNNDNDDDDDHNDRDGDTTSHMKRPSVAGSDAADRLDISSSGDHDVAEDDSTGGRENAVGVGASRSHSLDKSLVEQRRQQAQARFAPAAQQDAAAANLAAATAAMVAAMGRPDDDDESHQWFL